MQKINFLIYFLFFASYSLRAQGISDTITEKEVSRIIHVLASDSFGGRGNLQPGQIKAAKFIGEEFKKSGLLPLPGIQSYFLFFQPQGGRNVQKDALTWNGEYYSPEKFLYIPLQPGGYSTKTLADFDVIKLDTFFSNEILKQYQHAGKSLIIWTDRLQPDGFSFFPENIKAPLGGLQSDILLVCTHHPPDSITLAAMPSYSMFAYNVVGILPGKTKPREAIIISAHYDHMGILPHERRDSIMNGANDDASGTTGVLALADYFAKRNDNARTLIFCAFAGEELGLKGSQDFIKYIDPDRIVAGINLEMIGIPQFGKKTVFITGARYSSLSQILEKSLPKKTLWMVREPDANKQLFRRSDNFSFVTHGIPAHTIMASDDDDRCYHRVCDEADRIDTANMTNIIAAVALAMRKLVSGEATPNRIRGF